MDKLTFKDIMDASIANMRTGSVLTTTDILIALTATVLCSSVVFYMYRRTYQGVLYQHSFNIALVLVSLITTLVVMTISGNLTLTLGMVGALSIVRFRTAVKDPLDIVFMFWAISIGIANGVAFFKISIVGVIALSAVLFGFSKIRVGKAPFLLVVKSTGDSIEPVLKVIRETVKSFKIKTTTFRGDTMEVTAEVRLPKEVGTILQRLKAEESVVETMLISYTNDLAHD